MAIYNIKAPKVLSSRVSVCVYIYRCIWYIMVQSREVENQTKFEIETGFYKGILGLREGILSIYMFSEKVTIK